MNTQAMILMIFRTLYEFCVEYVLWLTKLEPANITTTSHLSQFTIFEFHLN